MLAQPCGSHKCSIVVHAGTCSWAPFVEQTIEMLRNAHECDFELGPGYVQEQDGTVCERYWQRRRPSRADTPQHALSASENHVSSNEDAADEQGEQDSRQDSKNGKQHTLQPGEASGQRDGRSSDCANHSNDGSSTDGSPTTQMGKSEWRSTALLQRVSAMHAGGQDAANGGRSAQSSSRQHSSPGQAKPAPCPAIRKKPYNIELVGVTCAPELAVARGFWRHLRSGRGVPVAAQLRSHRLFADNWPRYCKLLNSATLYHTGACHATLIAQSRMMVRVFWGCC